MENKKYTLTGVIKDQEKRVGIPDLVVVALDFDPQVRANETSAYFDPFLLYDRLGSVLTDAKGQFTLGYDEDDFKVSDNEPRPDIMLAVLAPEVSRTNVFDATFFNALSLGENIMHLSPPIRLQAGKMEAYSILISKETLEKFKLDRPAPPNLANPAHIKATLEAKTAHASAVLNLKIQDFNNRLAASAPLKDAADALFIPFTLSSVNPAIRAKDTYYSPEKDLSLLQDAVIDKRLTWLEHAPVNHHWKVKLTPKAIEQMGLLNAAGSIREQVPSNTVWSWWTKHNDTILERNKSAYEDCIRYFREEDLDPVVDKDDPGDGGGTEPHPPVEVHHNGKVNHLVNCITCPEEPLRYAKLIDADYKTQDIKATINGLELISGPTDVTSYHDFDSIQIAFESIWTEVFDKSLMKLGKDIFAEVVQTDDETCKDKLLRSTSLSPSDPESLKFLLREYRSISGSRSNSRLDRLFTELEERLAEPYKFDVFAPNSINYGVVFTYRQKWEPGSYQVGRLVKTVPMAPNEVKKYKTKVTTKLTKAQKEIEDREFKGSSESSSTARAESEIINRATNKTSFQTNMQGQVNMQMYNMSFGMNTGMESEKFSSATKKNFRESVLKAAQEYRKQTKLEVETGSEITTDNETSGKLVNPNDEISVTYLFYELQRQFMISEQLHKITPIITVAFEVPKPHDIDNDWLMTYGWIIRRVLLDESYHSALDYITTSSVGSEIAMSEMGRALRKQQKLVDELNRELEIRNNHVDNIMNQIVGLMTGDAVVDTIKDTADFVHKMLNPLAGLFGGGDTGPDLEKYKEVLQLQLERSEKEQKRLEDRLKEAQSELLSISQKFGQMTREHFDQQTAIAQLRIHIKENILYYMQAIWDYEPHDQRYFRLYDLEVDWFEDPDVPITTSGLVPRYNSDTGVLEWVEGEIVLPVGGIRKTKKKLVDVADIDNLLGFKGNYAIFPVKDPNYIHLHMMKDFIDTQTGGVKDADELADLSTQDLIDYLKCIRTNHPTAFEAEKDHIIDLINERRRSPRRERELVIVPSDSLYIECLPGKHAVLEDFKLVHRAIDVKKAQAEVRKLELENLRYAERLLANETSDPEVEKSITINGQPGTPDIEV